ncbi:MULTISPECIES: hypothetical protein [unclassified Pseudomonas]|uniref:hypothetical protein n=1 Tax=unclassified Pseudomonas TaxID=196821 RepID=UPI00244D4A36|nr:MULTISPECIES: hypothetical protein [unclassified Pseudomonas]MDG9926943.1 hypothetical protein [Pseudomonas sp. GD04042]MDH0484586.1 hypothetical protein [Pseudomonas sp. GD04015]MDH0602358.1 hypothetical protein [Pseudomonas sp. GD03869]
MNVVQKILFILLMAGLVTGAHRTRRDNPFLQWSLQNVDKLEAGSFEELINGLEDIAYQKVH